MCWQQLFRLLLSFSFLFYLLWLAYFFFLIFFNLAIDVKTYINQLLERHRSHDDLQDLQLWYTYMCMCTYTCAYIRVLVIEICDVHVCLMLNDRQIVRSRQNCKVVTRSGWFCKSHSLWCISANGSVCISRLTLELYQRFFFSDAMQRFIDQRPTTMKIKRVWSQN